MTSLTNLVSNWLKVLKCYSKTSNGNELLVNIIDVCDFHYKTHFVLIRQNMTPLGIWLFLIGKNSQKLKVLLGSACTFCSICRGFFFAELCGLLSPSFSFSHYIFSLRFLAAGLLFGMFIFCGLKHMADMCNFWFWIPERLHIILLTNARPKDLFLFVDANIVYEVLYKIPRDCLET